VHILVGAIGRNKDLSLDTLLSMYQKRLSWKVVFQEVESKKELPPMIRQEKEAELLMKLVPAGSLCIALDERGDNISSRSFASMLEESQVQGFQGVVFLIGGADGHGALVREKAHKFISFGAATWPHMLVRVMLMEQIYRAQQILKGHPYHRD
jgi:23S rRNA (pseudouridine1915-N3)-methyltransferase